MNFRTEIQVSKASFLVTHQSKLLLLGSCFVENIGEKLIDNKFQADINPFGILYNPASIAKAISLGVNEKAFTAEDIFFHQGLYHSFMHHGDFSRIDENELLSNINCSLSNFRNNLPSYDVMFVTFGTSYVFIDNKTNDVVANCHKLPADNFLRRRLDVDEIVDIWKETINSLRGINPDLKIVFTVSPIRHWKDGVHDNQLSKATLLLSIEKIQSQFDNIIYFPSYELVLDDLRDYRFYAEDMIHPNDIAINYIWEKFEKMFFDEETLQIADKWSKIRKAISHKPFNEDTLEYQHFLKQTLLKIKDFSAKYPYIYSENERQTLEHKLLKK